ncbi:MAG: siphovirus ReqiPepy6 Gp37-like family protein [Candidatus Pseudoruminococcus sp.]|nr:siphovirus ReqiPepy6 Gp37-like family protein [Ruminococcus sp.]MDY2783061.1 siphovirus ReqiPepy6 Gp37-like family protein [Candidatus Pseudoruminococcus sp.]
MEIPSIKILSPSLQLLNEIDLYTSLQFTRSWQGVGSFELHVLGNQKNISVGNLIMLSNNGHRSGVIRSVTKTVDVNGVTTTVSGQTLDGFTTQRVIIPSTLKENGGYFALPSANSLDKKLPAETIIKSFAGACFDSDTSKDYYALDKNRQANIEIAKSNERGSDTNWLARYDLLNEVLQSVSEYCDCGWEIYIDLKNRKLIFDYVAGVDRSANQSTNSRVILSRDYESIDSLTYTYDTASMKNLAYCGGVGEDFDRIYLAVTNDKPIPKGLNRFEVFEDCGSLEIGETDTTISLSAEGKHKLKEYKLTETLTAEIAQGGSFEYLKHWNLGDLVTVSDREIGLMQDLRITEVSESYESDNSRITVTLGTSPERLSRVIKKIKPTVR